MKFFLADGLAGPKHTGEWNKLVYPLFV